MTDYTFRPQAAIDIATGDLVQSQTTGQAFALSDEANATPLSVRLANGTYTTSIPIGVQTAQFTWESGQSEVKFIVEGVETRLFSLDGYVEAINEAVATAASLTQQATDAAAAAAGAQLAAEAAASSAAGAVKKVNGISPDATGNVTIATGGGSGAGTVITVNNKGADGAGNVTLVPGDLGAAAANHNHAASAITSGTIAPARLGSGATSGGTAKFLREDNTWVIPPTGGGGGTGSVDSVNGIGPDGSGNVTLTPSAIGLGAVNNTADINKPISNDVAAALLLKANDDVVVKTSGAQSIAGVKTFTSSPVVPDSSFTIAKTTGLQTALDGKVTSTISGLQIVEITVAAYNALSTPRPANVLYLKKG